MQAYSLKFIMVGDSGVGKSQLSKRFTKKQFKVDSQITVGMEFTTKDIVFERCVVKAQIWDTAGQERFEAMTKAYFAGAVGALLVYDVTNPQSFENLRSIWVPQVKKFGHDRMRLILVGNKTDKVDPTDGYAQRVSMSEAIEFARSLDCDFIEVSALSGVHVDAAFRRCILSVARLLPDVIVHLDLNGLPEGWIKSYQNVPLTSNSSGSNKGSSMPSPEGKTSNKSVDISTFNSQHQHGSSTGSPNSSLKVSSQNTTSNDMENDSPSIKVIPVYINYWTGEERINLPSPPKEKAENLLLFEASKGVEGNEVTFRDSRLSDVNHGEVRDLRSGGNSRNPSGKDLSDPSSVNNNGSTSGTGVSGNTSRSTGTGGSSSKASVSPSPTYNNNSTSNNNSNKNNSSPATTSSSQPSSTKKANDKNSEKGNNCFCVIA